MMAVLIPVGAYALGWVVFSVWWAVIKGHGKDDE